MEGGKGILYMWVVGIFETKNQGFSSLLFGLIIFGSK